MTTTSGITLKRTLRHLLIGGAVAALPSSCGPAYVAPPVTPQLRKLSVASSATLCRGYEVHQLKCAKCHSFQDPARHEVGELKARIIPEMARKSKLDAADEKALLDYLLAARQIPPPPPQ